MVLCFRIRRQEGLSSRRPPAEWKEAADEERAAAEAYRKSLESLERRLHSDVIRLMGGDIHLK